MSQAKQQTVSTLILLNTISEKYKEIPRKITKEIVSTFLSSIENHIAAGERVRIDKVGILAVKDSAARKGRNPQTGQEIMIPARKKITFKTSKTLKDTTGVQGKKVSAKKEK